MSISGDFPIFALRIARSESLKQDPALLGGVSIRMGSLLLDATLQAALNDMRSKLHNA